MSKTGKKGYGGPLLPSGLASVISIGCHLCVGSSPTSDNAENLSQYDSGCWTGHKTPILTLVKRLQHNSICICIQMAMHDFLNLKLYTAYCLLWRYHLEINDTAF